MIKKYRLLFIFLVFSNCYASPMIANRVFGQVKKILWDQGLTNTQAIDGEGLITNVINHSDRNEVAKHSSRPPLAEELEIALIKASQFP